MLEKNQSYPEYLIKHYKKSHLRVNNTEITGKILDWFACRSISIYKLLPHKLVSFY